LWSRYEVAEEDRERMNLPVYFRERHSKHTGGSTGTMLFGQPLLITVPRQNLAADMLYEKVLERIGWVRCLWACFLFPLLLICTVCST
jgi:hypothetical protein